MIITRIEEYKKDRYKIFLDGEFAFVLYKGELKSYNIKQDSVLDDKDYTEIVEVVLPKRAKLRAMNLLKSHMYTEKMLRDKLKESGHTDDNIDIAIEYVKSYKYLDDEEYTRQYLMSRIMTKSKKVLKGYLSNKGISSEVFENVYSEFCEEDDAMIEQEPLVKALNKKLKGRQVDMIDNVEKEKLIRHLLGKGFPYNLINKYL